MAHPELHRFLDSIPALSAEDKAALAQELHIAVFPKGTVLLQQGGVATYCYFILKGCVRQFVELDAEEKTTAFYTERQAVVSWASFTQGVPADHAWVCVEDTVTIAGTAESEVDMMHRIPSLQHIVRQVMEQDFGKVQAEMATFITSSAEERYVQLMQTRPDLLQRVPQHQIASYIGVTPESLSRIRKRMTAKK